MEGKEKLTFANNCKVNLSRMIIMAAFTVILVMGVLGFGGSARAADYYVDYESGNDSNNGLRISTPWKHCPGDDNSIGNPLATTLQAGDTVIFKGGVEYSGEIGLDWSGSLGSPLTYDGNSAGAWGAGRAIVDGGNTEKFGFGTGSSRNYITIKNFEIRNIPHDPSVWLPHAGIGIGVSSADSIGIIVQDCYIWNIGHWEPNGDYVQYGSCIRLDGCQDCLVDNNVLTKCSRWGVRLYVPSNTTVSNNEIYEYIMWGIDIAASPGIQPTDNVISDNVLHDIYQYDCKTSVLGEPGEGYWEGPSCTDPDNPHTDFIFVRIANGDLPPLRTIIERNLFYNDRDFGSHYGGTAMIYCSDTQDTVVRNNVFINPHSSRIFHDHDYSDGTEIYNNVFYGRQTSPGTTIYLEGTNEIFKNNIVVSDNTNLLISTTDVANSLISDYNLFAPIRRVAMVVVPLTAYETLVEWQGAYGEDNNSVSVATASDVKFVDISGFPTSCNTMDFRLQADSPAIDVGTDLSVYFTTDKDGVTRPQGQSWDIGAYEYIDSGPDTTPPTRFNESPTGELIAGTTQTTISLSTNETATCKYGTLASVPYDSMTDNFTNTNSTSHSTNVSGLSDGNNYNYYIRCIDTSNNANTDDFKISFSVATQGGGDTGDDGGDDSSGGGCFIGTAAVGE